MATVQIKLVDGPITYTIGPLRFRRGGPAVSVDPGASSFNRKFVESARLDKRFVVQRAASTKRAGPPARVMPKRRPVEKEVVEQESEVEADVDEAEAEAEGDVDETEADDDEDLEDDDETEPREAFMGMKRKKLEILAKNQGKRPPKGLSKAALVDWAIQEGVTTKE